MDLFNNKNTTLYLINEFWDSVTLLGTPIFYVFIIVIVSQFYLSLNPFLTFVEFLLLETLCFLLKMLIPKYRPAGPKKNTLVNLYHDRSFPSIHSARVSFLVFILCTILSKLILFFIAMVFFVGYSRIYLRKHDVIDVLGGIFLGLFFGLIWRMM